MNLKFDIVQERIKYLNVYKNAIWSWDVSNLSIKI